MSDYVDFLGTSGGHQWSDGDLVGLVLNKILFASEKKMKRFSSFFLSHRKFIHWSWTSIKLQIKSSITVSQRFFTFARRSTHAYTHFHTNLHTFSFESKICHNSLTQLQSHTHMRARNCFSHTISAHSPTLRQTHPSTHTFSHNHTLPLSHTRKHSTEHTLFNQLNTTLKLFHIHTLVHAHTRAHTHSHAHARTRILSRENA